MARSKNPQDQAQAPRGRTPEGPREGPRPEAICDGALANVGPSLARRRAEFLNVLAGRRVQCVREYLQQLRDGTAALRLHLPVRRPAGTAALPPGPEPPPFLIEYAARRDWKLVATLGEHAERAAAAVAALLAEEARRGYAGPGTIRPHRVTLTALCGYLAVFDRDAQQLVGRALDPSLSYLRERLQDADAPGDLKGFYEALGALIDATHYFGVRTGEACRGLKVKGRKGARNIDWPTERLLCDAGAAGMSIEDLAAVLIRWELGSSKKQRDEPKRLERAAAELRARSRAWGPQARSDGRK